MANNLNDDLFTQLRQHLGHKLTCVSSRYDDNSIQVAIECETCGCVLLKGDLDDLPSVSKLVSENRGYWGEHPDFPPANWQYEVLNGHTREGYWEWVRSQLEDVETVETREESACEGCG